VIEQLSEWLAKTGSLSDAAKKMESANEMQMRAGCGRTRKRAAVPPFFVT
jgi:hypothetical protein